MKKRSHARAAGQSSLHISLPSADLEDIKLLASNDGRTVSDFVRRMLKREISRLAPRTPMMLEVELETDYLGQLQPARGAVQIMSRIPFGTDYFGVVAEEGVGGVLKRRQVGVFKRSPAGYYPKPGDVVVFAAGDQSRVDLVRFTADQNEDGLQILAVEPVVEVSRWNTGTRRRMQQEDPKFANWYPPSIGVEWWRDGTVEGILQEAHGLG